MNKIFNFLKEKNLILKIWNFIINYKEMIGNNF